MTPESKELEREAIALWKQYGFFLNRPAARGFLVRLADFLNWQELRRVMK